MRHLLAERLRNTFYYGWIVAGVVFTSNMVTFSVNPTFGLFVVPLEQEFGWERSLIARSLTLGTVMGALLSPGLGMLLDRFGTRRVMALFGTLGGLCYALLGLTHQVWQFNLLMGLAFALTTTSVGQLMGGVVVNRWFVRRRGRAMGSVMVGASLGAFLLVPLQTWLINGAGWRWAYAVHGALMLLLVAVPALLLLIDLPEQAGLGGHEELGGAPTQSPIGQTPSTHTRSEPAWTLGQAARTRAFWFTLAGVMLGSFSVMGYFIHAVPHMESVGFSRSLAGAAWSTFFLVGVGSKFLWGFVIERTGVRWSLVFLFAAEAAGLVMLLVARSPIALFTYAVVNGLGHGPYLQLLAMVWAEYFGRRSLGAIQGAVQPAIVISASMGPWAAGYLFDLHGNYTLFLLIAIVFCLAAALLFMITPPPQPRGVPAGVSSPVPS